MSDSDYTQYKAMKRGTSNIVPKTPDFTYEHFPVVCPSCEGTGRLEEDASDMVTFVPVKDERLQPAWTKLKIAVLILIILLIGGCATYFLYPRDVMIQINAYEIVDYNFLTSSPWIEYSFTMKVNNHNFYAITLNCLTMQILYEQVIVSNQTFTKTYNVGMRTVKNDIVKVNASYDSGSVGKFIRKECYENKNYIPQLMVSYAELSYWMHTQNIQSKDDYFFTDCASMIFPLPTKKVTNTHMSPSKPATKTTFLTRRNPRNSVSSRPFYESDFTLKAPIVRKLFYSTTKPVEKMKKVNMVNFD